MNITTLPEIAKRLQRNCQGISAQIRGYFAIPRRTSGLLAALIFASLAITSMAQSKSLSDQHSQMEIRYELFQMLLEEQPLEISNLGDTLAFPQRSVIVAIGNQNSFSQSLVEGLSEFAERGGSLLLASKQRCNSSFGVIQSGSVYSTEPATMYRESAFALRVRTINIFHPLMSGIRELVAENSGWLDLPDELAPQWQVAAVLPDNTIPKISRAKPWLLTGEIPQPRSAAGRVVLSANVSVFSNRMIWHQDNAILAIQIANFISANRSRLCFLVDAQQMPTYRNSPLLQPKPIPQVNPNQLPTPELDAESLLKLANGVIVDVEESNALNEALQNRPRHMRPSDYARTLGIVALVLGAMWICWSLLRQKSQRITLPPERIARVVALSERLGASRGGRLKLATEALARDVFRECTGTDEPHAWRQFCDRVLFRADSQIDRPALPSLVPELLGIATDGLKTPISANKVISLGECMRWLRELKATKAI